MRKFFTKKRLVIPAAVAGMLVLGVAAYAYFTATGTGTGSGSVGTSDIVQLSGDPVGTLYPAGDDLPVTVNITNPGSGTQHIDTISATVADNGTCLGSWFEVDPITYNGDLAAGASDSADTFVRMLDSGTNQDDCQGLSMTINWTSN
jgi:hypothetical protein